MVLPNCAICDAIKIQDRILSQISRHLMHSILHYSFFVEYPLMIINSKLWWFGALWLYGDSRAFKALCGVESYRRVIVSGTDETSNSNASKRKGKRIALCLWMRIGGERRQCGMYVYIDYNGGLYLYYYLIWLSNIFRNIFPSTQRFFLLSIVVQITVQNISNILDRLDIFKPKFNSNPMPRQQFIICLRNRCM